MQKEVIDRSRASRRHRRADVDVFDFLASGLREIAVFVSSTFSIPITIDWPYVLLIDLWFRS